MCLGIPGEILEIKDEWGVVDSMGIQQEINLQLIHKPAVGDYVLIHGGFAIEKINQEYFEDVRELLKQLLNGEKEYE